MLIRNSTSVGFQCCVCGHIGIHTMELFVHGKQQNIELLCPKCGAEVFKAHKVKKGGYNVEVPCPVCFTPHDYNMSMLNLWNSEILSLKCAYENSEASLIGEKSRVTELLDEVFEPFEPFEPSNHYLNDEDFDLEKAADKDIEKSVVNNFLKYLRMTSGFGDEFLSVEDVLDDSYIPEEDMTVIKFIIKICQLIEDDCIDCVCGECDFGSTDAETEICDNVLSIVCKNCGRKLEIELDPINIKTNFSDIEFINIE